MGVPKPFSGKVDLKAILKPVGVSLKEEIALSTITPYHEINALSFNLVPGGVLHYLHKEQCLETGIYHIFSQKGAEIWPLQNVSEEQGDTLLS